MPSNPAPALALLRQIAKEREENAALVSAVRGDGSGLRAEATTLDRLAEVLGEMPPEVVPHKSMVCTKQRHRHHRKLCAAFVRELRAFLTPAHPDQETTRHG